MSILTVKATGNQDQSQQRRIVPKAQTWVNAATYGALEEE
jgi:hypothetical protein